MSESVNLIDMATFRARKESGLYEPIHDVTDLKYIDCGDDRELTQHFQDNRGDVTPGRLFGSASGLALTAVTSLVMSHGETAVRRIIGQYGPEAIVRLGVDISDAAHKKWGIDATQHSAEGAEQCFDGLAPDTHTNPLGCAFNAVLGTVATLGADIEATGPQIRTIHDITDTQDQLRDSREAQESLGIVAGMLGGKEAGISRAQIIRATSGPQHTPITIVAGSHAPGNETSVVLDLAGFRAKPSAEDPTYHHTPRINSLILPDSLPEFNFDTRALEAASLVLGVATQRGLGVERMDIIPQSLAS